MNPNVATKTDSGDKNSYQFLFKLLIQHLPEQTWETTYKQMKTESQSGKNIHWKQIFYRVAKDGLSKGPESREWRTLLKLLEIVREPDRFLTKDGRQVIRWKNQSGGKSAFLKKCENMIHHHILSLLRSCIENSQIYPDKKILFEETLKDSHSPFDNFFSSKREDDHPNPNNFYMEDNMEFHDKVSKKLRTGTMDYTYDSQAKIDEVEEEEIFQDTEETITNLVGKVGNLSQNQMKISHDEEKINSNNQAEYYNVFQNDFSNPIMMQDEKDRLIEDLRRQLEEKNRIIVEKNQRIANLEEKLSRSNLEGFRNLTLDEEELTQFHVFKLNSTGSNN